MRNPVHALLSNTETHLLETASGTIILCALSQSTSAAMGSDTDRDLHLTATEMTDHSNFWSTAKGVVDITTGHGLN